MRIDYNILWFDDNKEWCESIISNIEDYLVENGFKLNYDHYISGKDFDKVIGNINDYDLILIDYALKNEFGNELIRKIRESDIFTEIVFYSQQGEGKVREIMKELGLDGIYCAGRRDEDFIEKVNNVINTTIKKVQDLTNLRGLIMAETSELDVKMEDIIESLFDESFGTITDIDKTVIKTKSYKSLKDMISTLDEIDEKNNLKDLLKKLDHRSRWRTVKRLCKKNSEFNDLMETLNLYDPEIITKRNDLAHSCEKINDNKEKIIKGRSSNYSRDDFSAIRKDLAKHSSNFDKIKNIIID